MSKPLPLRRVTPFRLRTHVPAGRRWSGDDHKGGRETQNLSSRLPKLICDQSFLREQLSGKLFTTSLLKVSPVCVFHYINYFVWEMRRVPGSDSHSLSPLGERVQNAELEQRSVNFYWLSDSADEGESMPLSRLQLKAWLMRSRQNYFIICVHCRVLFFIACKFKRNSSQETS